MIRGEVWLARFPFEEDNNISKLRPVVVISQKTMGCCRSKLNPT